VSLAYKLRFVMQMNAREAMHLIELRTTPQGHPAYRMVAQEMHRLIAEEAGHRAIAEMMRFADHSPEPELERLDAERRAEARRQGA
jgi:thymidylate synthase ThyX